MDGQRQRVHDQGATDDQKLFFPLKRGLKNL